MGRKRGREEKEIDIIIFPEKGKDTHRAKKTEGQRREK